MTCHIAMSGAGKVAMLSDSQGSTEVSEFHGWQKQFAGPDFLLGVAGSGMILDALFQELDDREKGGNPETAATIPGLSQIFYRFKPQETPSFSRFQS